MDQSTSPWASAAAVSFSNTLSQVPSAAMRRRQVHTSLPEPVDLGQIPPRDSASVSVDDRLHHRAGFRERPAGPAGPGGEHRGDQLPLGIGEDLKPGHAFQVTLHPWTIVRHALVAPAPAAPGRGGGRFP